MKEQKKKAVVLLSGGLDSAVAAAMARAQGRRLFGLTFDYGQSHRRELRAARALAGKLGFEKHVVLKLALGKIAAGALLAKDRPMAGGAPSVYVTFRNGVFLSLALSFAEAQGAFEVWGGWCGADRAGFPDCRKDFLLAMEKAARLGTQAGRFKGARFKIVSPLAGLTKARTIKAGAGLGLDFALTWTCYQGGARPCGKCLACRLRKSGFKKAGLKDPLSA